MPRSICRLPEAWYAPIWREYHEEDPRRGLQAFAVNADTTVLVGANGKPWLVATRLDNFDRAHDDAQQWNGAPFEIGDWRPWDEDNLKGAWVAFVWEE